MRKNENAVLGLIAGAAVGGTLMYLADPDRGNRRRALMREKVNHELREFGCVLDKGIRDLRNRTRGIFAEAWSSLRRETVSDELLVDRVRAKIGRVVSHPHEIEVSVKDGHVKLSGPVLEDEIDDLIAAAYTVRGVHSVENRLEPHKPGENVPGLQGPSRRGHPTPELLQENWAPGTRLLVGAGGAIGLAFPGRNQSIALPGRIIGGLLLGRAVTNLPLRTYSESPRHSFSKDDHNP